MEDSVETVVVAATRDVQPPKRLQRRLEVKTRFVLHLIVSGRSCSF